ncbi:AMMECR1 domain-containing protein [Chytridium lagenaria]|nr:AMMECR1 domain-containing protein [Chytridium lagenaria]
MDDHCHYCFSVLLNALNPESHAPPIPSFKDGEYPLFVTWNILKSNRYILRGCIGTFSPISLHDGLKKYALISIAFSGLEVLTDKGEGVSKLSCGISLLVNFEERDDCYDWEIGFHGIWIEFHDHNSKKRTATFLPEVARSKTLHALLKKGGFVGRIDGDTLKGIKLTRYQSKKRSVTFQEYAEFVNNS